MKWKSKVVTATVAVTLVGSTLTGIPLSSKGLAELTSVSVAYANERPFFSESFLERMRAIHAGLHIEEQDVLDVRRLRDEIRTLTYEEHGAAIDPIWNKLADDLPEAEHATIKQNLFEFVTAVGGIWYDPNLTDLEAIRNDPDYRSALVAVASAAGYGDQTDLTVPDIFEFIFGSEGKRGVEGEFRAQLAGRSSTELALLLADETRRNALLRSALGVVLRDTNTYTVSAILSELGVNEQDIIDTSLNFRQTLQHENAAIEAMAFAYLRSEAKEEVQVSANGRRHTFKLSILGIEVPSLALEWSKVSEGGNLEISPSGVVTLIGNANSGTATIRAEVPALERIIFQKEVTVYRGGGDFLSGYVADMERLIARLPGANEQRRLALIRQGQRLSERTWAPFITPDISSLIDRSGQRAQFAPSLQVIQPIIDEQTAAEGIISEQLGELGGSLEFLYPAMNFDFERLRRQALDIRLSADILASLKEADINTVTFIADGMRVNIPIGQFSSDLTFSFGASAPPSSGNASEAYELEIQEGGQPVGSLEQPILIEVPTSGTGEQPEEIVSAAPIVNGELQETAAVNGGSTVIESLSGSFTYAIVSQAGNGVTFHDIDSVRSWAGAQIQAIAAKGIIEGVGNGSFAPQAKITRAQFAKMLVLALDLPQDGASAAGFGDVISGDWFAPFVESAYAYGIIQGRDASTFAPHAPITRAEMATMITRGVQLETADEEVEETGASLDGVFADSAQIHASLKAGVAYAAEQGLIVGSEGSFYPNRDTSRAEGAVVIYRLLDLLEQQ
ncbi:S-layer homology domain-containing protein [Paenibacillus daejeonensis]|uniref:S-layer homology domain-containing protein n=1 Tax=Paenibacillus daejeonensis TaxID=135193 RepID=UPI0003A42290|nr:S-layer homology domain-containing protein [Paenibacillus daejeonensis]